MTKLKKIVLFVSIYILLWPILHIFSMSIIPTWTDLPILKIFFSVISFFTPAVIFYGNGGGGFLSTQAFNPFFIFTNILNTFIVYKMIPFIAHKIIPFTRLIFNKPTNLMKKIFAILFAASIILNLFLVFKIVNLDKQLETNQKSVKNYIYARQTFPWENQPNIVGSMVTKVIPDFIIPGKINVFSNKSATPLDTSQLKNLINPQSALLVIYESGTFGYEPNEDTILAYSNKSVEQIVGDEQRKAELRKSGYNRKDGKNYVLLEDTGSYGPGGDNSIALFSKIYLIDVSKENYELPGGVKTFLIIPTHYSTNALDVLKKNIENFSIIPLPYWELPMI